MEKIIKIGLFKDDQGEESIQIAADIYGLIEIQRVFLHLSDGLDSFNFSDLPLLDIKNKINLVAYADSMDIGLRLTENETYEWRVTKAKWSEFRDNLIMMVGNFYFKPVPLESNAADKKDLHVVFSLDVFNQFEKSDFNDGTC